MSARAATQNLAPVGADALPCLDPVAGPQARRDGHRHGAGGGIGTAAPEAVDAVAWTNSRRKRRITSFGRELVVDEYLGRWVQVGATNAAEILAVHAALLRTGKIVYFGGDQHTGSLNAAGDVDHTRLFDCATHAITTVTGLTPPGMPPSDISAPATRCCTTVACSSPAAPRPGPSPVRTRTGTGARSISSARATRGCSTRRANPGSPRESSTVSGGPRRPTPTRPAGAGTRR